jgi:hypothetical protein
LSEGRIDLSNTNRPWGPAEAQTTFFPEPLWECQRKEPPWSCQEGPHWNKSHKELKYMDVRNPEEKLRGIFPFEYPGPQIREKKGI